VIGRTDPGRIRATNEDAFVADEELGLFAVADGMGGHNAGEVASRLALDTLVSFIRASRSDSGITWPYGFVASMPFEANQLKSAIQLANQEIRFRAQRQPECEGMGSTIVALIAEGARIWYANVGDSRLYLWRDGALTQLSEDDSWAASMLRAGADPEVVNRHEMRHMLTRALGTGQALDIAVSQIELQPGDVLLACSDGLYGPVGDAGLAQVLASAGGDVDAAAGALIAAALDGGGPDNVTALLVGLDGSGGGRVGRGERGQALTEYVVTAGLLVAIGIVVSAMLIDVMRNFVIKMVHELSFLTP
jgi:protein phosphatase